MHKVQSLGIALKRETIAGISSSIKLPISIHKELVSHGGAGLDDNSFNGRACNGILFLILFFILFNKI